MESQAGLEGPRKSLWSIYKTLSLVTPILVDMNDTVVVKLRQTRQLTFFSDNTWKFFFSPPKKWNFRGGENFKWNEKESLIVGK